MLSAGWTRNFAAKPSAPTFEPFAETTMGLETADYFVTEVPEPRRMTYPQLDRYISELRQSGYDVLEHEVELYRKIAFPFVTLVMTFIAVPFAVTTGRRGAMYGIGVGIVLALVYWTMISVFAAFGAGGLISPLLAAWAPEPDLRRRGRLPAPHRADLTMGPAPGRTEVAAPRGARCGVAAGVADDDSRSASCCSSSTRKAAAPSGALARPLAVLMAGGALLAFGIAMLIWEMSVRYGIRR